ncbi:MAG: hypothetical protein GX418_00880 [Clostridiales bacterium]|nr:hypothetical protein [Clostridiales bacterium]
MAGFIGSPVSPGTLGLCWVSVARRLSLGDAPARPARFAALFAAARFLGVAGLARGSAPPAGEGVGRGKGPGLSAAPSLDRRVRFWAAQPSRAAWVFSADTLTPRSRANPVRLISV